MSEIAFTLDLSMLNSSISIFKIPRGLKLSNNYSKIIQNRPFSFSILEIKYGRVHKK